MNTQKLTQKSLEAIQAANGLAVENQNQQIEQVHLLSALLEQEGGLIPQLFEKMGVSVDNVQIQLKNRKRSEGRRGLCISGRRPCIAGGRKRSCPHER